MHSEADGLLFYLNSQREHVLGALEGLPDESLRRAVLPSGWTALGLVRHLALDVERLWFQACVAGEKVDLAEDNGAWQVPPDMPASAVRALYREETEKANAIIAATPLDAMPRWWPDHLTEAYPARPLHQVILHVLTETATHAGHLDAVRELIDGKQWIVLG